MFLAKHGLAAHRDVAFIQIGGMPEIATALSKKIIAAAPMYYPMVYAANREAQKCRPILPRTNSFRSLDADNHEALSQRQAAAGESFFACLRQGDALPYNRQAESVAIIAKSPR